MGRGCGGIFLRGVGAGGNPPPFHSFICLREHAAQIFGIQNEATVLNRQQTFRKRQPSPMNSLRPQHSEKPLAEMKFTDATAQ